MHIPLEPPAIINENRPPTSWPQEGKIDLLDLHVRMKNILLFHCAITFADYFLIVKDLLMVR